MSRLDSRPSGGGAVQTVLRPDFPTSEAVERCVRGVQIDDFSAPALWGTSNASVAADTSDTLHGPAVKITTAGTNSYIEREAVLSLRQRFVSFWFKALDSNWSDCGFALTVSGVAYGTSNFSRLNVVANDATTGVQTVYVNEWRRVCVPMGLLVAGGTSVPGDAALDDVRKVRINFRRPTAGSESSCLVADLRMHDIPIAPGVVWQFDDARDDTYSTVYPILAPKGYVGSVAVPTSLVGTAGKMTVAQMQELVAAGWEMCSHTVSHSDLTAMTLANLQNELRNSYDWLIANGFPKAGARHLIYPGGLKSQQVMQQTLQRYKTGRTIIDYTGGVGYETPYVADYGMLRVSYFTSTMTLATAKTVCDTLVARGGVAIFALHSILASPSAQTDWSTADFTSLVDYAASLGLVSYRMDDLWGNRVAA